MATLMLEAAATKTILYWCSASPAGERKEGRERKEGQVALPAAEGLRWMRLTWSLTLGALIEECPSMNSIPVHPAAGPSTNMIGGEGDTASILSNFSALRRCSTSVVVRGWPPQRTIRKFVSASPSSFGGRTCSPNDSKLMPRRFPIRCRNRCKWNEGSNRPSVLQKNRFPNALRSSLVANDNWNHQPCA
jgi:hypothetical protein